MNINKLQKEMVIDRKHSENLSETLVDITHKYIEANKLGSKNLGGILVGAALAYRFLVVEALYNLSEQVSEEVIDETFVRLKEMPGLMLDNVDVEQIKKIKRGDTK